MSPLILQVISVILAGASPERPQTSLEPEAVAQLTIDSLLSREARWKQGELEIVILQTGAGPMLADFTLRWSGEEVLVDFHEGNYVSLNSEGQLLETKQKPFVFLVTPTKEWSYLPAIDQVQGYGVGYLRRLDGDVDARPSKIWSVFPDTPQLSLVTALKKGIADGLLTCVQLDNGLLRLDQRSVTYDIDPSSDFDIVRLESYMRREHHSKNSIGKPLCLTATYDWERDSHGVPFCQEFRIEFYSPDQLQEAVAVKTYSVSAFDSELTAQEARFDLDVMGIPEGTQVRYSDSTTSKSWRYGVSGSEAKGLQQPDFDRLIDELKQKGFAKPGKQ